MLRRRGAILAKRRVSALALIALAFAGSAQGSNRSLPWEGGPGLVTPFESKASEVAATVSGRAVSVECNDGVSWRSLGSRLGFDSSKSWAVTPFHWDSALDRAAPDDVAHFSPRACRFGDAFWLAATEYGTRTCRVGVRNARGVRVPAGPVLGECELWAPKLTAVHVLSHESVHLHGFYGEAHAECLAVQIDAHVAVALGAEERFARSMASEFWTDHYIPRSDAYRSVDCHDGGSLDLFPSLSGWPTPRRYPRDLHAALSALESKVRLGGGGSP